jgi:hypothetical protein
VANSGQEDIMRMSQPTVIELAVIGLTLVPLLGASPAAATEGPWCALTNRGGNSMVEDCSMRSLDMCRKEVIAGNRGFCNPNPRWHAQAYRPSRRYR